jgi:hypothetical protein
MNQIIESDSAFKPTDDPPEMREFVLAAMRCGRARILLLANEIDAAGIALRNNMVALSTVYDWLEEMGAWPFLNPDLGKAESAQQ